MPTPCLVAVLMKISFFFAVFLDQWLCWSWYVAEWFDIGLYSVIKQTFLLSDWSIIQSWIDSYLLIQRGKMTLTVSLFIVNIYIKFPIEFEEPFAI